MSLKLIIPRDPLIFRDGKPFTAVPGERAKSMLFPFPATLAGAVRTREGTKENGEFDGSQIDSLLKRYVRGPFLVELDDSQNIKKWYFPAPADALLISKKDDHKKIEEIYALSPLLIEEGISDLGDNLKLVGTKDIVKEKPMKTPPLYWNWKLIQQWLLNPADENIVGSFLEETIHGPERETRTHVSIDSKTKTAMDGALFQTSGMEFIKKKKDEKLSKASQLALALETNADFKSGLGFLGGERRVVHWKNVEDTVPTCPEKIVRKIKDDKHCRLIFVTPAYFKDGYIPTALENKYTLKVEAVALPCYQTVSGWDYKEKAPKPTRRLVPAGSVYFITFNNEKVIEKFISKFWLSSIFGEGSFEGRDGFGIALLGTWNGELQKLEVKNG